MVGDCIDLTLDDDAPEPKPQAPSGSRPKLCGAGNAVQVVQAPITSFLSPSERLNVSTSSLSVASTNEGGGSRPQSPISGEEAPMKSPHGGRSKSAGGGGRLCSSDSTPGATAAPGLDGGQAEAAGRPPQGHPAAAPEQQGGASSRRVGARLRGGAGGAPSQPAHHRKPDIDLTGDSDGEAGTAMSKIVVVVLDSEGEEDPPRSPRRTSPASAPPPPRLNSRSGSGRGHGPPSDSSDVEIVLPERKPEAPTEDAGGPSAVQGPPSGVLGGASKEALLRLEALAESEHDPIEAPEELPTKPKGKEKKVAAKRKPVDGLEECASPKKKPIKRGERVKREECGPDDATERPCTAPKWAADVSCQVKELVKAAVQSTESARREGSRAHTCLIRGEQRKCTLPPPSVIYSLVDLLLDPAIGPEPSRTCRADLALQIVYTTLASLVPPPRAPWRSTGEEASVLELEPTELTRRLKEVLQDMSAAAPPKEGPREGGAGAGAGAGSRAEKMQKFQANQRVLYLRFLTALSESERSCVSANKEHVLKRTAHVLSAGLPDKGTARDASLKDGIGLLTACLEAEAHNPQAVPALKGLAREVVLANAWREVLEDLVQNLLVSTIVKAGKGREVALTVHRGKLLLLEAAAGAPSFVLMQAWRALNCNGKYFGGGSHGERQRRDPPAWKELLAACTGICVREPAEEGLGADLVLLLKLSCVRARRDLDAELGLDLDPARSQVLAWVQGVDGAPLGLEQLRTSVAWMMTLT